jgi:hypothetical protein
VHALSAGPTNWTYGGSILTFAFPMILVIAVLGALYVLYTKPHLVPGHRYHIEARAASATPAAATPGEGTQRAGGAKAGGTSPVGLKSAAESTGDPGAAAATASAKDAEPGDG